MENSEKNVAFSHKGEKVSGSRPEADGFPTRSRFFFRIFSVSVFFVFSAFFSGSASLQAQRPRYKSSRGVESSMLTGGQVLAFTKGPGQRTIYTIGSPLKVKLLDGTKVSGRVNLVRDTAFMLGGRMIPYDSLAAYYVPVKTALFVGSALCIAGGGYMILDGFNGLVNGKKPAFHTETLTVGLPLLAVGGAIIPFKEVKRRTKIWKPRPMELW